MNEETIADRFGVLFVDDEENILRSIRRLFIDEDFEIFAANSGENGLAILKEHCEIALIVSDQMMPGMKGVQFLEKAKALRPAALRMLLTGYSDINAVADAINKGGACRYITKPWNDDDLVQTVREALRIYKLTLENDSLNKIIHLQNKKLKNWNTELEERVQVQTIELSKQNESLKKLYKQLRSNFKNTITAFSGLIELRDKQAKSHSKNVARLSVDTAKAMNLSKRMVESITIAALLHDIGKIGIPDAMLIKNVDELNAEEMVEYMTHPIRGQAAIALIEDLRDAGILIRHHHERYDGKGFPDSLSGDKIPIGSRIIFMADYIDRHIGINSRNNSGINILYKIEEKCGAWFDPKIFQYMKTIVPQIYINIKPDGKNIVEMELLPGELEEGMVVSRAVKTGTGVLLINKGVTLDKKTLNALKRLNSIDPLKQGVFVWVKR